MKYNYSSDQLQSIVPVECGGDKGTAFFISDTKLLTARHVVISAIRNKNIDAYISLNGKNYACTVTPLAKKDEPVDIAVLKLKARLNYKPYCFKLLSATINSEWKLTMIGYPAELGNNQEKFELNVVFEKTLGNDEYDMLLFRNDLLQFVQYIGFSGSPILNETGTVLGIASAQYNHAIQATSIKKITKYLKPKGISYDDNSELEDMTTLGLGYSVKMLQDSLRKAGNRYIPELYIEDH